MKYTRAQQKKNRLKWIKALRSQEYKQGRGSLRQNKPGDLYTFCCLGVACDLFRKEHPENSGWKADGYFFDKDTYMGSSTSLSDSVQKWLGLKHFDGRYFTTKGKNSLIHLNDHSKLSFKSIANTIEREPKGLIDDIKSTTKKKSTKVD